jgi:hypothetical protein
MLLCFGVSSNSGKYGLAVAVVARTALPAKALDLAATKSKLLLSLRVQLFNLKEKPPFGYFLPSVAPRTAMTGYWHRDDRLHRQRSLARPVLNTKGAEDPRVRPCPFSN